MRLFLFKLQTNRARVVEGALAIAGGTVAAMAIVASALSSDRQNYVHCLATTHKLWQFFFKSENW
jgi:hypothetical protein